MHPALRHKVQTHPLWTFYLLAFGISWAGWIPALAATRGLTWFQAPGWKLALVLPATGPAVAAALTLRLAGDTRTAGERWRRLFVWRVRLRWYLVALGGPLILWIAVREVNQAWFHVSSVAPVNRPFSDWLVFAGLSALANPWEEVGWRGFALPRLQARYHAVIASGLVGVLWAAWHLPLFFLPPGPMSMAALAFWPWSLGLIARSFLLTWLYNRANRSVLITALFHVSHNVCGAAINVTSERAAAFVNVAAVLFLLLIEGPALGSTEDSSAEPLPSPGTSQSTNSIPPRR